MEGKKQKAKDSSTLQWLVSPEDVVLLMLKLEAGLVAPQRLHALAGTVGAATCYRYTLE